MAALQLTYGGSSYNITALYIKDANIADNIFLRGGVSSQFAEATGAPADPESWE